MESCRLTELQTDNGSVMRTEATESNRDEEEEVK